MKTTFQLLALVSLLPVVVSAQIRTPPPPLPPTDTAASVISSTLEIRDRGDHHRVWQRVTVETDNTGKTVSRTNAAYTELETGMNVRQADGTWVEASDEIEIAKAGAVARKGRHQVIFSVNCNSPVAIDMLTADGKRLQSRILGLAYFDTATGQSVLIAEIKDSDGHLLMDTKNEVIYYDAFTDFKVDLRYRNSKAGLEQDLILREDPPSPAYYNLDPATTVLEVLTEFFNPPVPEKKARLINGVTDEFLNFGDLKMGTGRVFVMGAETTDIPVSKQWGTVEGRTFLIEEIPYQAVEPQLDALPKRTASLKSSQDGVRHQVSIKRLLPPVKQAKKEIGPMKLASAPLDGKGVVLDYVTASSATNYTFQCDTTYYVSGTVNLSGTNTSFEGGTVIKYSPTNAPKLNITSPITWLGSAFRPVVMTGSSDNTVGDTISGSTGNPNTNYFANPALYIDGTAAGTNAILQNLRISYAQSAIVFNGKTGHIVSHAQLVNCANGIAATNAEFSLRNALLYNVITNFNGSTSTGRCEHLTVDTANWLNNNNAITLTMTNSLLLGVTNVGTFTSNTVNIVTASAFQTVGAASHYLATGSVYRNVGTTNINATLAKDLKKLTTYPPIERTNDFTVNTVLSPQAGRDTDAYDLGYHYDPLDYVVSGRNLTNSILTLANGIVLGTYGALSDSGITLRNGAILNSAGSASYLNWIVRYNTVQEQSTTNWSASTVAPAIAFTVASTPEPQAQFTFTGWSLLGNNGKFFNSNKELIVPLAFKDCQFAGGGVSPVDVSVAFTNCLWERVAIDLSLSKSIISDRYFFNNLFWRGSLNLANTGTKTWILKDNLFDQTALNSQSGSITHSNNAYVNGGNRLTPTNVNDVVMSNTPIYLTNYLGRFYYPTNGGLLSMLINAGSRNATNAGLYHYTTTTNQVKEASSTVDIGFHYVATDTSGVPIDTDSDGVADYLEDRNGNGAVDTGETAWTNAADWGLSVIITKPRPSAILP